MRKYILIVGFSIIGLVFTAGNAAAVDSYMQFDILINLPRTAGTGSFAGEYTDFEGVNDFLKKYPIVIPDLRGHYFFEIGPVRIGPGARGFSALIQTILWPTITAEFDAGPVRFTTSAGGGAFMLFGFANTVDTQNIWLPEATVAYKFNEWFHAGLSGTGIYLPDVDSQSMGFIWGIFARFSLGGNS